MACTTEYIEFVCSQLAGTGHVRPKKMFGDWLIYVDEKPAVLACDNICYVRMLPAIDGMMTDAQIATPYQGAKPHYVLDIEHRDTAAAIVKAILPAIQYPKKRKK